MSRPDENGFDLRCDDEYWGTPVAEFQEGKLRGEREREVYLPHFVLSPLLSVSLFPDVCFSLSLLSLFSYLEPLS